MSISVEDFMAKKPRKRSRKSKIVGAVVGFITAASLVAVAAWVLIPTGNGDTYGVTQGAQNGVGITTQVATATEAFGPGETATFAVKYVNTNSGTSVKVTDVSQTGSGQDLTAPGCTIPAGTLTVQPLNASEQVTVTANGTASATIRVAVSSSAPVCMSGGHTIRVPISIQGTAV